MNASLETTPGERVPRLSDDQPQPRLTGRAVLVRFILYPLLVVSGCVLAFGLIWWVSHDARTPAELLATVRNADGRERWQAAHEFARRVAADPTLRSDRNLGRQVVAVFGATRVDDPAVAGYLAQVLGLLAGETPALPPAEVEAALVEALAGGAGVPPVKDAALRIRVALALADVGGAESTSALATLLDDEDGGVRKAAAYAIARLTSRGLLSPVPPWDQPARTPRSDKAVANAVRLLTPLLRDRQEDVSWNAALGLAALGSDAGVDVLRRTLDRSYLNSVSSRRQSQGRGMTSREVSDVMVNAVRAAARLERAAFRETLLQLRDEDEDPRVQEAARLALGPIPTLSAGAGSAGEGNGE